MPRRLLAMHGKWQILAPIGETASSQCWRPTASANTLYWCCSSLLHCFLRVFFTAAAAVHSIASCNSHLVIQQMVQTLGGKACVLQGGPACHHIAGVLPPNSLRIFVIAGKEKLGFSTCPRHGKAWVRAVTLPARFGKSNAGGP